MEQATKPIEDCFTSSRVTNENGGPANVVEALVVLHQVIIESTAAICKSIDELAEALRR